MFGLGPWEMILVFLIVLLLFGAKRLPEIGSSLGKGIRAFKGSVREIEGELNAPLQDRSPPPYRASQNVSAADSEQQDEEEEGEPRRLTTDD